MSKDNERSIEQIPELFPEHFDTNLSVDESKISLAEVEYIRYRRKNIIKTLSSIALGVSSFIGFELYAQLNNSKTYDEHKTIIESSITQPDLKIIQVFRFNSNS